MGRNIIFQNVPDSVTGLFTSGVSEFVRGGRFESWESALPLQPNRVSRGRLLALGGGGTTVLLNTSQAEVIGATFQAVPKRYGGNRRPRTIAVVPSGFRPETPLRRRVPADVSETLPLSHGTGVSRARNLCLCVNVRTAVRVDDARRSPANGRAPNALRAHSPASYT